MLAYAMLRACVAAAIRRVSLIRLQRLMPRAFAILRHDAAMPPARC